MSSRFEELDFQPTPLGDLTLRRRFDPALDLEIFEVKLGEEYLMSSAFTVAEEALADLGLAVTPGENLRVLVGGLGLGYTAIAALRDPRVANLTVIDTLPAVIDWHERGLLPVSAQLTGDARTHLVLDDFFAVMRAAPVPADGGAAGWDAILLDVDHSPRHQLDAGHADLYTVTGLQNLARHLGGRGSGGGGNSGGGVFALWSDDPPDDEFLLTLRTVFPGAEAHVVDFANALTGGISSNTVYVAVLDTTGTVKP